MAKLDADSRQSLCALQENSLIRASQRRELKDIQEECKVKERAQDTIEDGFQRVHNSVPVPVDEIADPPLNSKQIKLPNALPIINLDITMAEQLQPAILAID